MLVNKTDDIFGFFLSTAGLQIRGIRNAVCWRVLASTFFGIYDRLISVRHALSVPQLCLMLVKATGPQFAAHGRCGVNDRCDELPLHTLRHLRLGGNAWTAASSD